MRYRSIVAALIAIVVSAVIGGVYGKGAQATTNTVPEHYRTFTAALSAIQTQYAQPVESDRMVYGAINGMLQTLDPHSSFMDPRSYAQMRERQEGRYYGLGLTIQSVDGDITAVRVFEGSPAFTNGIRRGDVIADVEGTSTKGWTTEATVNKLKGPKGTFVKIGVRRKGFERLLEMNVMRDQVSIPEPVGFVHDRRDDRLRRHHRLRRAHRRRPRPGARGAHQARHEAPGARPAQQSRRPARSGHPHHQPLRAQGLDGGLHPRARGQFRLGLSRDGYTAVHEHPDDHAGQSQQRERVGNRIGRAAGLRPLIGGWRDDVR